MGDSFRDVTPVTPYPRSSLFPCHPRFSIVRSCRIRAVFHPLIIRAATMKRIFALCLFLLITSRAYPAVITGGEIAYRVVEGDSLLLISAKLGANMKAIARENSLDPDEDLHPGQELRIN